jgi:hypothetical protein
MSLPPSIPHSRKPLNRWWFFLWGFLAGLAVAVICTATILIIRISSDNSFLPTGQIPAIDAQVYLIVENDGCSVERSELTGATPVSNLTWVIRDLDGFTLLERNAEGEYKYRYFGSGSFTVSISAWYAGSYHQISEDVRIDC